jgi:hypothetical protein
MTDPTLPRPYRLPPRGMPLTAFEEHMLLDDRPSHPMAIVTRFDFSDAPPPAALEKAFEETLRSEPLLSARIAPRRRGRPRWIEAAPPRLVRSRTQRITIDTIEWTGSPPRLDPHAGNVLHAEVIEHDAGWSILMAVHHAASDGIGIIGFLERWLLAAEGKRSRRRRQSDATMAVLATRDRVASSWTGFTRMVPKLAKGLEGIGEFVRHDIIQLSEGPPAPSTGVPASPVTPWQPLILTATMGGDVVAGLEQKAKAHFVTVNDLLATALLVTIGNHVSTAGNIAGGAITPATGGEWIRVAIPMSLRTKHDHALPAANRVSMVFLDRRPEDRHDADRLAASIHDQMEVIRSHALGHIFPMSLAVGRLLPGGLARTVRRPKPQCTAVLSNVGRTFHRSPLADADGTVRVGGGRLVGWWGVPPIRPGTALAVGTHETCGRRTVAFHVDRHRFRSDSAQTLLQAMVAELNDLAAIDASAPTAAGIS